MAQVSELPCDADGVCMVCKVKPSEGESLTCNTCATPWHAVCLATPPKTLADAAQWTCPDCSDLCGAVAQPSVCGGGLVEKILAIESDASLTDREKVMRRQELLGGAAAGDGEKETKGGGDVGGALQILGDKFNCSICMQLLDKPISTPCGHNFCLKCFKKWTGEQHKKTCAICRKVIPDKMAREPRINSAIVMAIRMAKLSQSNVPEGTPKVHHFIHNQDRPDKAFTTERARRSGKANACSGKIFVTVPTDYFGPITMEDDPERNQGVLVGETWEDRMECRQWGAHFPHVAGIGGQADRGAQSVALSGGYEDDEDHGDWFLYTGSGGRDLSGNKRTNKLQSFDQTFTKVNEALRVSCKQGYPVRVVRSHKEKRSSYAPLEGVRYDGIYRIEKCWRKAGVQGHKVCRYLFVRCDNEPAPWTSDTHGDLPRSKLPPVPELNQATDISERKGKGPAWDYDEENGQWMWKRPQPESRKALVDNNDEDNGIKKRKRQRSKGTGKEKLLKEFGCLICRKVMVLPLTTPCAHNFCKACLEGVFAGQSFIKERTRGGRQLRAQKTVMKCPSCTNDISDFLQNPQVNREMMDVIKSVQAQLEEESLEAEGPEDMVDEMDVNLSDESDVIVTEDKEDKDDNESDDRDEIVAENKEVCDSRVKKDDADKVKASIGSKPLRVSKRNKARSDAGDTEDGGTGDGVSAGEEYHETAKSKKQKIT